MSSQRDTIPGYLLNAPSSNPAVSSVMTKATFPTVIPTLTAEMPAPNTSSVDFECVRELGPPCLLDKTWPAVEIWTTNRVYALDARLVCLSIHEYGGPELIENSIVGSRLIGGQLRNQHQDIARIAQPYPLEGMNAIFSKTVGKRQSMSETTSVVRVIIRSRVVDITH